MNRKEYAAIIQAWADDPTSELECDAGSGWFRSLLNDGSYIREYRLKPKPVKARYRVVQFKGYTGTLDSCYSNAGVESREDFVGYLTDWIEYEAKS